jgi:hypothetical protein
MNGFITKNKRLLKIYCRLAQLLGCALLLMGGIWYVCLVNLPSSRDQMYTIVQATSWFLFGFMVPGVVAVGTAQFVRYLSETDYKAGWILRHGDLFFYLWAAIEVTWAVFRYFYFVRIMEEPALRLLWTQLLILPTIAKVLILVSLGQILRRIIPIIGESKTLV